MRAAHIAALVAVSMLATPALGQAYTVEGPSQAMKETAERLAREGAEQAAREKQEHEAKETQEREAREHPPNQPPPEQPQEPGANSEASSTPPVVRCVVPSLRGKSLGAAQAALRRAHCKLGRVSKPHAHRGALVVTAQSPASGKKLADGAVVAVTLGSKVKRRS